jgi:twitching motility two-component system response regulator PilH
MPVMKVLIVDDDRTQLLHLQNVVAKAGYLTITAVNGTDAVGRARSDKPDVVLMDVNMPSPNGFEATRVLKADPLTRDIPVIFVTSKNQKADRLWAKMQGGHELIAKPYTDEQILECLKNI